MGNFTPSPGEEVDSGGTTPLLKDSPFSFPNPTLSILINPRHGLHAKICVFSLQTQL